MTGHIYALVPVTWTIIRSLQPEASFRTEIAKSLEIADRTISRKLNHLIELDAVSINGSKYDKNHTYSLNER